MKITKKEKSLWNFLNIFKAIFSKSDGRTIIYGKGSKLFLNTLDYFGVFISKENTFILINQYDFGNNFYELKQLPNGTFVLDESSDISQVEVEVIVSYIMDTLTYAKYQLELNKREAYKVSLISRTTDIWFRDSDLGFLNFPKCEVYKNGDALIFKSGGITDDDISIVETSLIINHRDELPVIQQKLDVDNEKEVEQFSEDELKELNDTYEEINELEEGYEDDPMSM